MPTIQIIYLIIGVFMFFEWLYMIFNFNYCYEIFLKERKSYNIKTPNIERKILNIEIVEEIGSLRAMIRTFGYILWFILGFFTPIWSYHLLLFIFNNLHERFDGFKANISKISFIFKLFAFGFIYLISLYKLFF